MTAKQELELLWQHAKVHPSMETLEEYEIKNTNFRNLDPKIEEHLFFCNLCAMGLDIIYLIRNGMFSNTLKRGGLDKK